MGKPLDECGGDEYDGAPLDPMPDWLSDPLTAVAAGIGLVLLCIGVGTIDNAESDARARLAQHTAAAPPDSVTFANGYWLHGGDAGDITIETPRPYYRRIEYDGLGLAMTTEVAGGLAVTTLRERGRNLAVVHHNEHDTQRHELAAPVFLECGLWLSWWSTDGLLGMFDGNGHHHYLHPGGHGVTVVGGPDEGEEP